MTIDVSEGTLGATAVAIGSGGTVLQVITEWANVFIIFGNVILILGGVYLMAHKIHWLHLKRKQKREEVNAVQQNAENERS